MYSSRTSKLRRLGHRAWLPAPTDTTMPAAFAGTTLAEADASNSGAASPRRSLTQLTEGHQRYREGRSTRETFAIPREELAKGQKPIAAILGCADSRVVPDFIFDQSPGRLFVVRVAGNFLTADGQASLEYGVEFLSIPLLLVLGHSSCGAVDAAVKVVRDGAQLPGKLPGLVDSIVPAVEAVSNEAGDLLENAIAENVRRNVELLRNSEPIIGPAAASGRLEIVGGVYDIASGSLEILD